MRMIHKMAFVLALAGTMELAVALPSIRLETAPTENQGSIEADDLGPAFSRPLAQQESESPPPPAQAPVEAKNVNKDDLRSLFQEDPKPTKEVNPLEELAKNEMKGLENAEGPVSEQAPRELSENTKQADMGFKPESTPKTLENAENAVTEPPLLQLSENTKETEMGFKPESAVNQEVKDLPKELN